MRYLQDAFVACYGQVTFGWAPARWLVFCPELPQLEVEFDSAQVVQIQFNSHYPAHC